MPPILALAPSDHAVPGPCVVDQVRTNPSPLKPGQSALFMVGPGDMRVKQFSYWLSE
jgi:hypothetical protein